MSIHLHASKRRPKSLKDADYDHQIDLIDHTKPPETSRPLSPRSSSPRPSPSPSPSEQHLSPELSSSSSRRHSDTPLRKHNTPQLLRDEIARRKYGKFHDRKSSIRAAKEAKANEVQQEERTEDLGEEERGRKMVQKGEPESAIDILYENQRGGFLCGMPLFSGRALGNLDPAPWTNSANKTSATNITNAQVPDPSWEWAWKEWSINHTEEVDEDGWEYSFMFAKAFSWHGPSWWNSFVRRRAWIRKRVKRHTGYKVNQAHMLTPDYFTIHPALDRSRSPSSTMRESITNRYSLASMASREMEDEVPVEDITDIGALMKALKSARIDREKMEAVESFIEHGGDDLYYLQIHMHEIMRTFIFQASRRLLLSHLLKIFNQASEKKTKFEGDGDPDPAEKRRLDNLEAAVKHADEEVKRLEFWSDVKDMAEKGETKGAVDEAQGWDPRWTGLDGSGPKSVTSGQKLPGMANCKENEGNGTAISHNHTSDKGKGKAKE